MTNQHKRTFVIPIGLLAVLAVGPTAGAGAVADVVGWAEDEIQAYPHCNGVNASSLPPSFNEGCSIP